MRSLGRLSAAACVLVLAVCGARAATRSEHRPGDGRKPLDEPAFLARATRLLSAQGLAAFEGYGPELPVVAAGRFLIVSRCRQQGCNAGRATLVLDTKSDNAWYVTLEEGAGGASRCWRGTRALTDLPDSVQRSMSQ